jgi:manganese transport system permease protein
MLRALLVSALVGGVCGLLSCYMTLKGWALMGDAVSHAVLPGVVVAYALGLPFSLGAFVFGVGSVAAIGFVKQKSRVKEDTVIGLVFTGFFALGLVLVSKTRSNIDLTHILFGNVLGINAADIVQTLLISLLVLVTLLVFRRDLMCFALIPRMHAPLASTQGYCITCCSDCCPSRLLQDCKPLESFLWWPCWSLPVPPLIS